MNHRIAISILTATTLFTTLPFAANAADPADVAKDRASATYEARKGKAEEDYHLAKKRCELLSGNAEDVCMKDAKAVYKSEKANAKADVKSEKAKADANEESREAEYSAAKERCSTLSGNAKDACVGEAKLKYHM